MKLSAQLPTSPPTALIEAVLRRFMLAVLAAAVLALPSVISAQTDTASEDTASEDVAEAGEQVETEDELEQIVITGTMVYHDLLPGSGTLLDQEHLELQGHQDINRLLRSVAGVQVREEDGYGLRPNISMRAVGGDRSGKITLMEDSIPIAPAPYSAPAAYYFPRLSRMRAVEVIKGSAGIEYGPFATGGSVNLLSTRPDEETGGWLRTRLGSRSSADLWAGGTYVHPNVGVRLMFEGINERANGFKELDSGGKTGFTLDGYVLRGAWDLQAYGPVSHRMEGKIGESSESSDATYLGLTRADYQNTPYRRYSASQRDRFTSDHSQEWVRYYGNLDTETDIAVGWTVTAYRTEFARNWYKLEQVGSTAVSAVLADPQTYRAELDILRGGDSSQACLQRPNEASCADTRLRLRANNRNYRVAGVQGALLVNIGEEGDAVRQDIEIGLRDHEDSVDRWQWWDDYLADGGALQRYQAGEPGTQSNRVQQAKAKSLYFTDRIHLGNDLMLNAGFRLEQISGQRLDWLIIDPKRRQSPRVRSADTDLTTFGIGAVWNATPSVSVFGNMYKGNSPTSVYQNRIEEADNLEIGVRVPNLKGLSGELLYYRSDYRNLTGTCTAASNCTGEIGDTFSAGQALVDGLEMTLSTTPSSGSYRIPIRLVWTQTNTEFKQSFSSDYDIWGEVRAGDEFAYVPANQLHLDIGWHLPEVWGLNLSMLARSEQRTTAGSGDISPAEHVPAYEVMDISARWQVRKRVTVLAAVRNLTDQAYMVSAHPAGVRPGLSRAISFGAKVKFK